MDELIPESGRAEKNYWRDLWRYRELFYFLAWRDILVRYKQTVIGIAWAVIRPFLTAVVFTVIFNRFAKLPAPAAVPYALLVMAASCPGSSFPPPQRIQQQPRRQRQPDLQDLFPAPHHPGRVGHHQLRGFSHHAGTDGRLMLWYRFPPDWRLFCFCRCS